jgi:alanyl-tRNA synthetase
MAAVKAAVEEAGAENVDPNSPSLKVIADHIRACTFIIADGVVPGNEGRSYVLRRIARRAMRHGFKLGARSYFFSGLVDAVAKEMGDQYPEVRNPKIKEVLHQEEVRFSQTLEKGMDILNAALGEGKLLSGELAFKLHDTYGFPLDLTQDVCRERGVEVDVDGFEKEMEKQREQARASGKFKMSLGLEYDGAATQFLGYQTQQVSDCTVLAVYKDGEPAESGAAGEEVVVVFDKTPFYAESGGQVSDKGEFKNKTSLLTVDDVFKVKANVFGHMVLVKEGSVRVGDVFSGHTDEDLRAATARNHSATHLLHKALREVLGTHVQQRGSMVNAERTRFDFVHHGPVTEEQIKAVEAIVNSEILRNTATSVRELPIEEAKKTGAMMLFGEKYGEKVRVVDIGSSCEFCGGTHVARTGDIGLFKIVSECGVAAGIRRIEAVTGLNSLALIQADKAVIHNIASALKTSENDVVEKAADTVNLVKQLEKEIEQLRNKLANAEVEKLVSRAKKQNGVSVLVASVKGVEPKALREVVDNLQAKLQPAVVAIISLQADKSSIAVGVNKELVSKVKAGAVVSFMAQQLGGKGGGRPDFAQGGGALPADVTAYLAECEKFILSNV